MLRALDRERFRVIPIGITRDGVFVLEDDDPDKFALDAAHLPEVGDNGTRVLWPEGGADRVLRVRQPDGSIDTLGSLDVTARFRAFSTRSASRMPAAACWTRHCAWTSTS